MDSAEWAAKAAWAPSRRVSARGWGRPRPGGSAGRLGFGEGLGSAKARRERRQAGLRLRDGTTVEGTIYVLPYSRPMDLVNSRDESFMAVTDVTIVEHDGQRWSAAFVAVNKADILFLYEVTNPPQP